MTKTANNLEDSATLYSLRASFIEKRKMLNLTVRELGKKANVSYTVIYDFEKRGIVPKVETLFKLADSLRLKLDITVENSPTRKYTKDLYQLITQLLLFNSGADENTIEEIISFIKFKLS